MATQKIPGRAIKLTQNDTVGDIAYYDGEVASWVRLVIGNAGEILTMNEAGTLPQWGPAPPTWVPQGTLRGYSSGGNNGSHSASSRYERIDTYSFTTDGDATDWGDLVRDTYMMSGTASATHGYVMRGEFVLNLVPQNYVDTIQKFSFAANADATDVGNCSEAHTQGTGHSSGVNGYCCYVVGWPITANRVDRFPFATDTNATDVGNLNINSTTWGGISSETHGYYQTDSGVPNGALAGNINQFSFANEATATDVGEMIVVVDHCGGSMSETHGYFSGGASSNQIQKFSFATLGNATDVGDLLHTGHTPACSSSTTHNYNAGGWMGEQNPSNQINKWSTSTDANATDVGNLWAINYGCVGAQV